MNAEFSAPSDAHLWGVGALDDSRKDCTSFLTMLRRVRKKKNSVRISQFRHVPRRVATPLPTICDIVGVVTDAGLAIVDSEATETVGSPEALQSVLPAVQKVMPHSKEEIGVEAGGAMTFKLTDGTTFTDGSVLTASNQLESQCC